MSVVLPLKARTVPILRVGSQNDSVDVALSLICASAFFVALAIIVATASSDKLASKVLTSSAPNTLPWLA